MKKNRETLKETFLALCALFSAPLFFVGGFLIPVLQAHTARAQVQTPHVVKVAEAKQLDSSN